VSFGISLLDNLIVIFVIFIVIVIIITIHHINVFFIVTGLPSVGASA
jgi:hypothetical protein